MATQSQQVLIAHTGQRLQVDISQFAALDDFKAWVAQQCSIPVHFIVALTPQGKAVRLQTIQTEKETYIYDIRITQASSPGTPTFVVQDEPQPKRYKVITAPNTIEDTRALKSWQDLFKSRRSWAVKVEADCAAMADAAQQRYREMDVMAKCLDAAVANLDTAVRPIEPKYTELKKWIIPMQQDYEKLATNWEHHFDIARSIPVSPIMVQFMTGREPRKSRQATLEDLIDLDTTRKAGKLANPSLRKFNARVSELETSASEMFGGCDRLFHEFDKVMARSALQRSKACTQLMVDIQAIARKIDMDYQTTLEYTNSATDVRQASKTAAHHTERLLPSLAQRAMEMDEVLRSASRARNDLASDSLVFMQSIADITSLHQKVKTKLGELSQGEEEMTTFDYLRLIQQLPFMYASFVAEAVRRREWSEKLKVDSSTLVNEMALFQDEELKRRRKWQKMVGSTYGPEKDFDTSVLGLEVNLHGEDNPWPPMAKKDLEDLLALVRRQQADSGVTEDIAKLISDLNNPTKQQSKRVKAFKNGSVHEATLGKSGLLIRGDDDLLRTMQEEKVRLENQLKTEKSRVRRLEGLLHRHSTELRPSMGNIFQPHGDSVASNKTNNVVDDRRRSSNLDGGEAIMRRVGQLESELNAEKERCAATERDFAARNKDMEIRVDEANSTKKDLLKNMDALKREFMDERKSLENDIKSLKTRLEETEDEIEHFGESRENEKAAYDDRLRFLEDEVVRVTREKKEDALRFQGQVEYLRDEGRSQREVNESVERQLQEAKDTIKSLSRRAETSEESTDTTIRTFRELHRQMLPMEMTPSDINDLMESVTSKSAEVLSRMQSLEQDIALLRSDLNRAECAVRESKEHLSEAQDKLASEEMAAMKVREAFDGETARCSALEAEIQQVRAQLDQLRLRMTEGETGSESLRKRLGEEEQRVAELSELLASRKSQVGSLEEEVCMYREKLEASESRLAALHQRFEGRNERTKDLTQRLFTHNDRMCRLLERLGFSVRRENGAMVIHRVPRAERTARDVSESSDPSSSDRRTLNATAAHAAASTDIKLLYWMTADDAETESAQYEEFKAGPGSLDIDAFAEAIYRRVREAEHTARKLQRDARGYRDRSHAAAKDAHDKIAFKHFKEGDLALFLPTRNQTTGAWAAFNVGCPHFFLREQEGHRLRQREWLVARITKIQERVVDLSKSLSSTTAQQPASETDSVTTGDEFDNPFDLSDGLRWWLIDAHEDKPGAPATPGLGKSTVAANNVEAMGDMHTHAMSSGTSSKLLPLPSGRMGGIEGVSKTLSKSLESRRSSAASSKKAVPFAAAGTSAAKSSALASETNSLRAVASDSPEVGGSAQESPSLAKTETQEPSGKNAAVEEQAQTREMPQASVPDGTAAPQPRYVLGHTTMTFRRNVSNVKEEGSGSGVLRAAPWSVDVSHTGT